MMKNKSNTVTTLLLVAAVAVPFILTAFGKPVEATRVGKANTAIVAGGLVIKNAWVQEGPPSQKVTAAFMLIENHSANEVSLVAAKTSAARVTEIHNTVVENEVMRMRKVDKLVVPANGSVELKPGGYHLMMIGLSKPLAEGDKVQFTLEFSDSEKKTLTIPVKKRT